MTDDRSLERAARSWIEVGPTRAPDHAVEAALARIQTTPQERDWFPWRFPAMFTPARVTVAAVLGVLLLGSVFFTIDRQPAAGEDGLVTFRSPLYEYSVAIDAGWRVRPAISRWLGSEPAHQSDPPFADRFDGSGSSAGQTVLIKARQLTEGTTSAAWMAQWEQTREVVGQCFGSATRWMDWTVDGVHARRLAWRCDSAAYAGKNYDEYTVVADGTAFVITGSPSMVAAVLGSIQLPD
jgi:hypothetical protein